MTGRKMLIMLCVMFAGVCSGCSVPTALNAPGLRALRVETATVSESADVTEVTARVEPADAETSIAWSLDWSEIRPETVTDFVRMETTAADPARVRLLPLRAFSGAMTLRAEAVGYPGIFGETAVTFGERFPEISLPLLQAGTPTPAAPAPVQSPSRVYITLADAQSSETIELAPRDREGNAVELYGGVAGAENTIEYRDGLPYYVRRTGKLVFDGSADEGWYAPGVSGDPSRVRMTTTRYGDLLKKGSHVKPKALWTIGTAAPWDVPLMGKTSNSFSINTEGDLTILTFYADEYSADNALARWKAYLAEHPSEFYFELETPVLTALDPASLPALEYRSSGYTVTTDVEGLTPAFIWQKIG